MKPGDLSVRGQTAAMNSISVQPMFFSRSAGGRADLRRPAMSLGSVKFKKPEAPKWQCQVGS